MAETSTIFGFMKYVSATDILSDIKEAVVRLEQFLKDLDN